MATSGTSPRSFLNCVYCRESKRKCEPYDFSAGERCRRCVAGGRPCGPRLPHSTRDPSVNLHVDTNHPLSPSSPMIASSNPSSDIQSSPPSSHFLTLASKERSRSFHNTESFCNEAARHPHSKKKRSSVLDAPQEGRAPSVKDLMKTKLNELGNLGDLFSYLHYRRRAASLNYHIREHPAHQSPQETILSILDLVRIKFSDLCEEFHANIPYVSSRIEKELFLRRADAKIQYFLQTASQNNTFRYQEDDYKDIKRQHHSLIEFLATACEENEDFSESHRLRTLLPSLREQYQLDLNISHHHGLLVFTNMSRRVSEAFRSLKIPQRHVKVLPTFENLFPPVHLAVYSGCANAAYKIVSDGICNPEACDILSRQALHIAAETGDVTLLRLTLAKDEKAKMSRDIYNMTPLCIAAYTGKIAIFMQLMEAGDDAAVRDITGRSILTLSSGAGYLDIVRYLLEKGYGPQEYSDLGHLGSYSALHAAAAGGHSEVVELLLRHRASALLECQGVSPAQDARNHGHFDVATRLDEAMQAEQDGLVVVHKAGKTHHVYSTTLAGDPLLAQSFSTSPSPYPPLPLLDDDSIAQYSMRSVSLSPPASPHMSELGSSPPSSSS